MIVSLAFFFFFFKCVIYYVIWMMAKVVSHIPTPKYWSFVDLTMVGKRESKCEMTQGSDSHL